MSNGDFRQTLTDRSVDLLWGLWQELGVLGRSEVPVWSADPEALLLWTSWLGGADRRLMQAPLGWALHFEDLLNTSRLKIMLRREVPCDPATLREWCEVLAAESGSKRWHTFVTWLTEERGSAHTEQRGRAAPAGFSEQSRSGRPAVSRSRFGERDKLRPRRSVAQQSPAVRFRMLFGVTTRAEVLRFFATGGRGNSNSIAGEIYLNQRGIFEVLKDLEAVNLLEPQRIGRTKAYRGSQSFLGTLGIAEKVFFNWANYGTALHEAFRVLDRWPEADSSYKRGSLVATALERFFEGLETSEWNRQFFRRDDPITSARVEEQGFDQVVEVLSPSKELAGQPFLV